MDIVAISLTGTNGPLIYFICRYFNKLTNNGTGEFALQSIYTDDAQSFNPQQLLNYSDSRSFDFDNDGDVDIISPIKKLINNGNGTFSPTNGFAFVNSQVADFTWDGKIDVAANAFASNLITRINDGEGNFTQLITTPGSFSKSSSSSGDFDNDGDVDIAVVDFFAQHVSILLNENDILSIELSSLTSLVNARNVTLNWSTSSEENNSGFEILRSAQNDNERWIMVGFIKGNGTSSSPNDYSFTDRRLNTGKYKYKLKQIDYNGTFKYYDLLNEVLIGIPDKFSLSQNYPNPFNPTTRINYDTPVDGIVTLKVYDVNGKEVKTIINEFKNAGYYTAEFDGINLSSGFYLYKLSLNNLAELKRMIFLK